VPLLSSENRGYEPDVTGQFSFVYLCYLMWLPDDEEIDTQVELVREWLRRLLTQKGGDLQWLVVWTNRYGDIPSITLDEFWRTSQVQAKERSIDPAFTLRGRGLMDSFLEEVQQAIPDPMVLVRQRAKFEKKYLPACLEAWRAFGMAGSEGTKTLKSFREWQRMATRVSSEEGPYFALLEKMAHELGHMADAEGLPGWLRQIYDFQAVKALSAKVGVLDKDARPIRNTRACLSR